MRKGKIAARPSGFRDWLKARMERGKEEGKLMTWVKGLPGAQVSFGPFGQAQSRLVKPGQAQSKRKQGFDRQEPGGITKFRNLPGSDLGASCK
jgi:hypothetical protein